MADPIDRHPAKSASWRKLPNAALFATACIAFAGLGHRLTIGPNHMTTQNCRRMVR